MPARILVEERIRNATWLRNARPPDTPAGAPHSTPTEFFDPPALKAGKTNKRGGLTPGCGWSDSGLVSVSLVLSFGSGVLFGVCVWVVAGWLGGWGALPYKTNTSERSRGPLLNLTAPSAARSSAADLPNSSSAAPPAELEFGRAAHPAELEFAADQPNSSSAGAVPRRPLLDLTAVLPRSAILNASL